MANTNSRGKGKSPKNTPSAIARRQRLGNPAPRQHNKTRPYQRHMARIEAAPDCGNVSERLSSRRSRGAEVNWMNMAPSNTPRPRQRGFRTIAQAFRRAS